MAFPLSPFAVPVGSFPFPVPPPTSDVGGCDLMSVQFPSKWLPYILGALQQLTLQSTWQGTPSEQGILEEEAWNIISIFAGAQCAVKPQAGMEVSEDMGIRVDCDCRVFVTCCDGTEVELLTSKNPGPGQPGAGSKIPQPNGGTETYCFALGPRLAVFAPAVVNSGDVITISQAKGAWHDGNSLFWYCPNGFQYILGTCSNEGAPINLGQLLATSHYMGIIASIGGVFYDVFNPNADGDPQPFTVPGGISNAKVEFMANYIPLAPGLPPGGIVDFCATIQNNAIEHWTQVFDFTTSPFSPDWVPVNSAGFTPLQAAQWTNAVGWDSVYATNGSTNFRYAEIQTFKHFTLDKLTVEFAWAAGTIDPADYEYVVEVNGSVVQSVQQPASPSSPAVYTPGSPPAVTNLIVSVIGGSHFGGADPGGTATITRITIEGEGPNPF